MYNKQKITWTSKPTLVESTYSAGRREEPAGLHFDADYYDATGNYRITTHNGKKRKKKMRHHLINTHGAYFLGYHNAT
jgi:hypothetical protein